MGKKIKKGGQAAAQVEGLITKSLCNTNYIYNVSQLNVVPKALNNPASERRHYEENRLHHKSCGCDLFKNL